MEHGGSGPVEFKVRTIIVTTTRTPRVKLPKVLVMTATSRSVAAMVTIAASITVSDDAAHGAHPPLRAPLNGGKAVLTLPPVYRGEGSGGPEDPGTPAKAKPTEAPSTAERTATPAIAAPQPQRRPNAAGCPAPAVQAHLAQGRACFWSLIRRMLVLRVLFSLT